MPKLSSLLDAVRSAVLSRPPVSFLALWRVAASMKPSETLTHDSSRGTTTAPALVVWKLNDLSGGTLGVPFAWLASRLNLSVRRPHHGSPWRPRSPLNASEGPATTHSRVASRQPWALCQRTSP